MLVFKKKEKVSAYLKAWHKILRIPFHAALVLPFFLGMTIAWSEGHQINWTVLIIATLGVFLATSECFLANEYFDYETDCVNRSYNRYTGGSRVLPEGLIPRHHVLGAAIASGSLALGLAIILQFYFQTGSLTIPLGLFGIITGYLYTAKPVQLAYRGLGEFSIGIAVGFLPIFGGYYIQTQQVSILPVFVALPWVLSAVLLIWINEFPDYQSDKLSGKRNLVVKLGTERASIVYQGLSILIWLFMFLIYVYVPGLPLITAVFLIPIIILSVWNLTAMNKGEWCDSEKMEKICLRQIVYSIMIPVVLIGCFIWRGTLT